MRCANLCRSCFQCILFAMHFMNLQRLTCCDFYEYWLLYYGSFRRYFGPFGINDDRDCIGLVVSIESQWMSQLNHLAERILGETTQFHLNFINIVYMFSVRSLFCQFWLLFGCAHYRDDLSEKGQHQISYIIACWQCFRQNFSKTNNQDNENMRKTKINTPKSAKQNDKTKDGAETIQTNQVFGVKHII